MPEPTTLLLDGEYLGMVGDVELYKLGDQLYAMEFEGGEPFVRIPWLDEIQRLPLGAC